MSGPPVVVPVSGAHHIMQSGDTFSVYSKVQATFQEMDRVENAFESLRTQINGMILQFPQHSLVPPILSMVETMVGPIYNQEKEQKDFAQNLRMTVETIMPWNKFLEYSV